MDAALRELSDQLDQATQRLLDTARVITETDLRAPSLLPGWTRAHVLAHVARNADALRNLLVGVRTGQDRAAYASAGARDADIEQGAGWPARDLVADLADSAMAFRFVARRLPDDGWSVPVRILDSAPFPAATLLTRRLVEVELHHCDLGTGYGADSWPAASRPWIWASRCGPGVRTGSPTPSRPRQPGSARPGRPRRGVRAGRCRGAGSEQGDGHGPADSST